MKLKQTFSILKDSLKILKKYPTMLLPLLLSWIIYAVFAICLFSDLNFEQVGLKNGFLIIFGAVLFYSVITSIASLTLLELIQQIETGRKPRFSKAFSEVFQKDFIKALPIMIIWAIIIFIMLIFEALTRKESDSDIDSYYTRRRTRETLEEALFGYRDTSLPSLIWDMFVDSGIRMIIFSIYPAIAWEDETAFNAVKKGFASIKQNLSTFISGFLAVEFFIALVFIPPALVIYFASENNIMISSIGWILITVYIACGMGLYLYLQQIVSAILYMWNLKWTHAVQKAIRANEPIPTINDIPKPDLLDDKLDLVFGKVH